MRHSWIRLYVETGNTTTEHSIIVIFTLYSTEDLHEVSAKINNEKTVPL